MLDDFGSTSSIEDTTVKLLAITAEIFAEDLLWQPGAEELIDAIRAAGLKTALVTNSTARWSRSPSACSAGTGSTPPSAATRSSARSPTRCRTWRRWTASGCPRRSAWPWRIRRPVPRRPSSAGIAVLVVPSEVPVPEGPGRIFANSLLGATVDELHHIHREFRRSVRRGSA